MNRPQVVSIVSTEATLQSYLDQLLQEATVEVELRPVAVQDSPAAAVMAPAIPAEVRPLEGPGGDASVLADNAAPGADADLARAADAAGVDTAPDVAAEQPATQGAPHWGQRPFQALVCRVGPLRIAVPLVKLREVLRFTEVDAAIPRAPEWVLGILRHRDRQVHVVDTARLIMPRQDSVSATADADPIRDLLLVGDGGWGLGCQEIGETITLQPEQVRWRSAAGTRPWLAGTVVDQLCALLDVDVLPSLLESGKSLSG